MLENDGQSGSRSRKILALAVAVVLSGITFVVTAGEALAQQHQTPPEVYAVAPGVGRVAAPAPDAELVAVTDTVAAEPVPETPPPAEEETLPAGFDMPAEALPVDSLPVDSLSAEPVLAEPMLVMADQQVPELLPVPEPISGLALQPDPVLPLGDLWSVPEVYSAPDPKAPGNSSPPHSSLVPELKTSIPSVGLALIPEPAASEGNKLFSPRVQEPPALLPVRPAPLQQNAANNAAPAAQVRPSSSPDERKPPALGIAVAKAPVGTPVVSKAPAMIPGVSKNPTTAPIAPGRLQVYHPSPSLGAAASSAVETFYSAAASLAAGVSEVLAVSESSAEDSTVGTEEPAEGTMPRPPAPSVPAGGSSFSLSSGGQVGAGSVVPLLLCVLASGLILPRRDGLLSLTSFESTEPISALLIPLERPG